MDLREIQREGKVNSAQGLAQRTQSMGRARHAAQSYAQRLGNLECMERGDDVSAPHPRISSIPHASVYPHAVPSLRALRV